jgi:predicted nucleic acid-binding Zn ribbon protein
MAFARKPKSMNELLKEFIKKIPQKTELNRGMVLHAWPKVVGDKISNVTKELRFDGPKLIVKVTSEAWRYEIHANRFAIAKKLNNYVKSNVVKEIIVRT